MPRIVLTTVLGTWLTIVMALLALSLALAAGWNPDALKALIELAASRALHHELRIGTLEGSIFRGLLARDLSLAPPGGANDPTAVLTVRDIAVDFDIQRSFRESRLVVQSLVIDGPRVAVSRARDGSLKIAGWAGTRRREAPQQSDTRQRIVIAIETLEIRDGDLELEIETRAMPDPLHVRTRLEAEFQRIRWRSDEPLGWPGNGQLDLALKELVWRGLNLGWGSMRWDLVSRRARLREVTLHGPIGELSGSAAFTFSGSAAAPVIAKAGASVRFQQIDLGLLRTGASAEQSEGRLSSRLAGELTAELAWPTGQRDEHPRLELHGMLGPSRLAGGDIEAGEIQGRYQLDSGSWAFEGAQLQVAAGQVVAQGHGDRSGVGEVELHAPALELAKLPESWLPITGLSGQAELGLNISGAWNDPVGSLKLTGSSLHLGTTGPAELALALSALGDRRYQIDSLSITVDEEATAMPGTFLRSRQAAALRIEPRGASVSDLELIWSGGSLAVSGGVGEGVLLPTRIALHSLDLATLATLIGVDNGMAGEMTGSLEAAGSLRRPDLNARLLWHEPRLMGLTADRATLWLESSDDRFSASVGLLRGDGEELRLKTELPGLVNIDDPRALLGDERASLELVTHQFHLDWLSPLFAPQQRRLGGIVDGNLRAAGGTPYPRIKGSLGIRDGRLYEVPAADSFVAELLAGPLSCSLRFGGTTLRVEGMRLGEGRREVAASAWASWQDGEERTVDFEAMLQGVGFAGRLETSGGLRGDELRPTLLSLSSFEASEVAEMAGIGLDLGGQLSSELVLSGRLQSPDLLGHASWERPRIGSAEADRMVLRAASNGDQLDVQAEFIRQGDRELSVEGRLPLNRSRPVPTWRDQMAGWPYDAASRIALQADHFDLSWLAFLAPRLSIRTWGEVDGALSVTGAEPIPLVEGEVELRDGVFTIANQQASAGPLDGSVRFSGSRASLDRLTLSSPKGNSQISGTLAWSPSGVDDVQLEILFEDFLFNQLGLLRTYFDGQLAATGALRALNVTGDIQLRDVRVSFPSPEDPVLKEIRVLGLPDARESASIYEGETEIAGLDENTSVDVTFVMAPGTWVRGMGLDAEVVGEVQVTKAAGERARYGGTLEVERGRYSLQGKRFELERGVAMFAGEDATIPDVDILATRQASQDVRVTAHLTGPANAPRLELTSEPPMDSAEIISFIFLGRSQDDDTDDPSGRLRASAASAAGALLVDNLAPDLRERLRIDQISVTSGDRDEPPAVEVESQLTPDVYLRLIQSLGSAAEEAVEVRWRFWRNFSLESKVKRSGASSIDLLWSYNYWGLERFGVGGLTAPPPPYRREAEPACKAPSLCE